MPVLVNMVSGLGAAITPIATTTGYGTAAAGTLVSTPGSIRTKLMTSAPQLAGAGIGVAALLGAGVAKAAIPIVGPAIAGASIAIALWQSRKGPYQKTATTEIVNEAEPILQDNLRAYMEGPHTAESQEWALANFDQVWAQVLQLCGDPSMGEPGRRCISERQRGGTAPWCPTGSGCDWFILYRDPIANDVPIASPSAVDSIGDSFSSIFGGGEAGGASANTSMVPLLIGAGLIGAALWL